jgi:hypothetical protein
MKVIRQICYEGTEEDLRKQLSQGLNEGKHFPQGRVRIEVRTVYSELPPLEPFVPLEGCKGLEPHFCGGCPDCKPLEEI